MTSNDITIKVDDIKIFFNIIFIDDDIMINEVVDKEEHLECFVVHFEKGPV